MFICNPDSTHAISWINHLKNTNFDVRIFSVYISESEEIQNLDWDFPTYAMSSVRKSKNINNIVYYHYTAKIFPKSIAKLLQEKFSLRSKWLKKIILEWKPDIIHSFPLNVGGKLAAKVLKKFE